MGKPRRSARDVDAAVRRVTDAQAAELHAAPPAHPTFEWAARFGYAAVGIVYVAIGIGAIAVALGLSAEPAGSHAVISIFAELPFGELVLIGLGVGLAGYAALNITGAINDPEGRGLSFSGLVERAVDALTGAIYIGLAIAALGRVADPARKDPGTAVAWARAVMSLPVGRLLMTLIALSLVGGGVFLFHRARKERFGEMLDRREVSTRARRAIAVAARIGTAARGLILIVCGVLVLRSAATAEADFVGDAGDALAAIGSTMPGPFLLLLTGAGFVAYGVYQLAKARYQRIAAPEPAKE
jgi:hypothetical protein